MSAVSIENGNKTVNVSIVGENLWSAGDKVRVYYDLSQDNKRSLISKLYQIVDGDTRDQTVKVGDKLFAFEFGIDANSKTKRAAILAAIPALVADL